MQKQLGICIGGEGGEAEGYAGYFFCGSEMAPSGFGQVPEAWAGWDKLAGVGVAPVERKAYGGVACFQVPTNFIESPSSFGRICCHVCR